LNAIYLEDSSSIWDSTQHNSFLLNILSPKLFKNSPNTPRTFIVWFLMFKEFDSFDPKKSLIDTLITNVKVIWHSLSFCTLHIFIFEIRLCKICSLREIFQKKKLSQRTNFIYRLMKMVAWIIFLYLISFTL